MTAAYFISAFLMMNGTPSLGWIQYTEEYSDISSCKEVITYQKNEMSIAIRNRFGKRIIKILKYQQNPIF